MDGRVTSAALHDEKHVIPDGGRPEILLQPCADGTSEEDEESYDEANGDLRQLDGQVRGENGTKHVSYAQDNGDTRSSARTRVKSLGKSAKRKSKHILDAAKARIGVAEEEPDTGPCEALNNNPAFEPERLVGNQRTTIGSTKDKLLGSAIAAGKAIVNPGSSIKKLATSKVAIKDRPYLSQEADIEYLDAHDEMCRAQSSNANTTDEDEGLIDEKQDRVDDLDNIRDGRKVAWTISQHIHRVMVAPPTDYTTPDKDDFYILDDVTGKRRPNRGAYLLARIKHVCKVFALDNMGNVDFGHASTEDVLVDKEEMMRYLERLLIVSAPWQSWFLAIRKLYRWEDPAQTRKWALIWFFIWYFNYVMTFSLSYAAFIVLRNKYSRSRVGYLRESYDRALSTDQNALRLNELINRHGSGDWLDPLIEEAGPLVQMQMSDLVDFLEVLTNFYDWRAPKKTWATLFWFACAIALAALTSTQHSMKVIWMFCYLSLFIGRPIASMYPQYRHNMNALRWIFWEIPTDAEWSMAYLRKKAQETRANLIDQQVEKDDKQNAHSPPVEQYVDSMDIPITIKTEPVPNTDAASDSDGDSWHTADSSTSILGGLDMVSFKCRMNNWPGRLIIFSDGLRFVRASPLATKRKELWRYPWKQLVEVRKKTSSVLAKMGTKEGLELVFIDGLTIQMDAVKGRDRAFNCILGFSGLQFQILQPLMESSLVMHGIVPRVEKSKEQG